jgi:Mor family transcriptional regulator
VHNIPKYTKEKKEKAVIRSFGGRPTSLTATQSEDALRKYSRGYSSKSLAKTYNVTQRTIQNLIRRYKVAS